MAETVPVTQADENAAANLWIDLHKDDDQPSPLLRRALQKWMRVTAQAFAAERHRIASQTASPTGDYGELIEYLRWYAWNVAPGADQHPHRQILKAADALSELQGRVERMGEALREARDDLHYLYETSSDDHVVHKALAAHLRAAKALAALTPEPSHDQ